jgi:hypothetical protein
MGIFLAEPSLPLAYCPLTIAWPSNSLAWSQVNVSLWIRFMAKCHAQWQTNHTANPGEADSNQVVDRAGWVVGDSAQPPSLRASSVWTLSTRIDLFLYNRQTKSARCSKTASRIQTWCPNCDTNLSKLSRSEYHIFSSSNLWRQVSCALKNALPRHVSYATSTHSNKAFLRRKQPR